MALQRLNLSFLSPGFARAEHRVFSLSAAARKSFRKWYREFWTPKPINGPPYSHITQVGDPVLRLKAAEVPEELINSKEVDLVIERMVSVMRKFECVGMAAPQIGISLRIIVMEFRENLHKKFPSAVYEAREMSPMKLKVFVNPTLKITNYAKNKFPEGCMSVRGFSAEVERYHGVTLSGVGKLGTEAELELNGWNARIAQHEMDHLDGKLYVDHMDRSTFICTCWEAINVKSGRVEIPFYK